MTWWPWPPWESFGRVCSSVSIVLHAWCLWFMIALREENWKNSDSYTCLLNHPQVSFIYNKVHWAVGATLYCLVCPLHCNQWPSQSFAWAGRNPRRTRQPWLEIWQGAKNSKHLGYTSHGGKCITRKDLGPVTCFFF